MNLFVDTSVWSLALRRDRVGEQPAVTRLHEALANGELVAVTGLVLQELLQGFAGAKGATRIRSLFLKLPVIQPSLEDHIEAANLRNHCRRRGVQLGTIDALIARLCIHHELSLLTTDRDFEHAAPHCELKLAMR